MYSNSNNPDLLTRNQHQMGQTLKGTGNTCQGQEHRDCHMSESIQALIKACVCRGGSGINMEMPTEPHKTAPVSYVTPATMFPCAAEVDGMLGKEGSSFSFWEKALSYQHPCPVLQNLCRRKSKCTTSMLSPTETSEAGEASTF